MYVVTELCVNELFYFLYHTGRFDEKLAKFYFMQILDGLAYSHNSGIAHRDLKPANFLLDDNYNLKIADFGFAAPLMGKDGSGWLTTKLGTPGFMAPEIGLGQPYEGEVIDLFAVGVTLF